MSLGAVVMSELQTSLKYLLFSAECCGISVKIQIKEVIPIWCCERFMTTHLTRVLSVNRVRSLCYKKSDVVSFI